MNMIDDGAALALEGRIIAMRDALSFKGFPADDIPDEALERAFVLLDAANGKRRVRTLDDTSIMEMIGYALQTRSASWVSGGSVPASYRYRAHTTIILTAYVDDRLLMGIGVGPAKAISPGRVWAQLAPWTRLLKPETRLAKLRLWAAECDPIAILGG
jgi:hypothetical protein